MFVQMPGGGVQFYSDISMGLDAALQGGGIPLDDQGNPMNVKSFIAGYGEVPIGTPGSGYLVNGCPLNVAFNMGMQPGQQNALDAAGISCQRPGAGGGCGCGCVGGGGGGARNTDFGGVDSSWNPVTYGTLGPNFGDSSMMTYSEYAQLMIRAAQKFGRFMPIQGTV